ncbi:MAG: NUDIX domain-containing protein [Lachnospiraceae bacterium]|nr:NUDIX domain-containing protein [Lachnospiraceae bacterium]
MEFWDIYDENKKRTGRTMKRNDWCLKEGEYHLSVLGVICRSDGRFLITKRAMDKEWAPGWWEVPGGGVQAGEASEDAVVREIKEETGLDVSGADGGLFLTYRRENLKEGDNYFVDVYRFCMEFDESDVKVQKEEVGGFLIADRKEIEQYGKEGIFLHYDSIRGVFE